MATYAAPVKDMQFILHKVLKVTEARVPGYQELDSEFTFAVLEEAGKLGWPGFVAGYWSKVYPILR